MDSMSRWRILAAGSIFVQYVRSAATAPLSVPASEHWYGPDGTWSAITIGVGTESPQTWVDVMVNTMSAETWVVGAGGCGGRLDTQCMGDRGGLFNPLDSSTWDSMGTYELGIDKELGNYGYADYGLDRLIVGVSGPTVASSIIGPFNGTSTINATYYSTGFFGVGVNSGTFNNNVHPAPPLNALSQQGKIPGNSYGFTAGAHYQQQGDPISLTLGGYDSSRLVWHSSTFQLNAARQPQTYIQGISLFSSQVSSNYSTHSSAFLLSADSVSAIIDYSTPYLWLPQAVCDRFANALGLVYDEALNLYTFGGNDSTRDALVKAQLSFNFTLSDLVASNNTVNITVPYAAFDLQLQYPAIPNTAYGAPNATRNYFPLRRADTPAQYRIGRAFLQEAYIIADYDANSFGVYQAVHNADPFGAVNLVAIPSNLASQKSKSFPTSAIIGVVIGIIVISVLIIFSALFLRRRRRALKADDESDKKPIETKPRTILDRLRGRLREPLVHEASGSTNYPTEVAADATHERFELPAPFGPAELDSGSGTWEGTTENGTADSADLSAYERARRKLERQQAAAMMGLQTTPERETYPIEKPETGVSQVAHYRPSDIESPVSPVFGGGESPTIDEQPSPVSPGFVSPPTSPLAPHPDPPPIYRRINPVNVVYAGRLPENVQLPAVVPRLIGADGRTVRSLESTSTDPAGTNSSLGSHFTERESEDLYGSGNTNIVSPIASSSGSAAGCDTSIISPVASNSTRSGDSRGFHIRGGSEIETDRTLSRSNTVPDEWPSRRRLGGTDLVHVPQPAENRFSWEEDKISGREEVDEESSL